MLVGMFGTPLARGGIASALNAKCKRKTFIILQVCIHGGPITTDDGGRGE